jgi:hypothetical protein
MKDRKYWNRLNTTIQHFDLPIESYIFIPVSLSPLIIFGPGDLLNLVFNLDLTIDITFLLFLVQIHERFGFFQGLRERGAAGAESYIQYLGGSSDSRGRVPQRSRVRQPSQP